ncbi:MAG: hypothetical protein ACOC21_03710, partial [Halanaerobiales bacterium]
IDESLDISDRLSIQLDNNSEDMIGLKLKTPGNINADFDNEDENYYIAIDENNKERFDYKEDKGEYQYYNESDDSVTTNLFNFKGAIKSPEDELIYDAEEDFEIETKIIGENRFPWMIL